jgi:DNA-binding transcriptional ArsR family regulator
MAGSAGVHTDKESAAADSRIARRARERVTSRAARRAIDKIQRVLCDEARARILQALSLGPLCVADIASIIDRKPAAASQHLRVLREHDLVERERRGTSAYYRLRNTTESRLASQTLSAFETV